MLKNGQIILLKLKEGFVGNKRSYVLIKRTSSSR